MTPDAGADGDFHRLAMLETRLETARKVGVQTDQAWALLLIADLHTSADRFEDAKPVIDEAAEICKNVNDPGLTKKISLMGARVNWFLGRGKS